MSLEHGLVSDVLEDHGLSESVGAEQDEVASLAEKVESQSGLDGAAVDLLGPVPVEVGHELESADLGALESSFEASKAIYVEGGLWTQPRQEVALKWLGLLRTSDREDLDVEFRSEDTVPPVLLFYAQRSPRVTFELVGLLNYCWVETEDFADKNTATLKRLLHEYLDVELREGLVGLENLDHLVVHTLRGDAKEPWTLNSTFVLLGSFFGDVLQKLIGGRWLVTGNGKLEEVIFEATTEVGRAKVSVFKRVLRLYDNGIQDGTAVLAREVLTQLGVDAG